MLKNQLQACPHEEYKKSTIYGEIKKKKNKKQKQKAANLLAIFVKHSINETKDKQIPYHWGTPFPNTL